MDEEPLPTERDFDPLSGGLDEQIAWENFGGLALEQALARFVENPDYYQEDFMFMGGKAFAFYFPVVERYLWSVPDGPQEHDHCAWILSHCIKAHFQGRDLPDVRHLVPRVVALANFVMKNIARFGRDDAERSLVAEAWVELVQRVGPGGSEV